MPYAIKQHKPARYADIKPKNHGDQWYCNQRWRRLRKMVLRGQLCVDPWGIHEADGSTPIATEVDHIKSRKEYPELTWCMNNLQPLCKPCHSRKTRGEKK